MFVFSGMCICHQTPNKQPKQTKQNKTKQNVQGLVSSTQQDHHGNGDGGIKVLKALGKHRPIDDDSYGGAGAEASSLAGGAGDVNRSPRNGPIAI